MTKKLLISFLGFFLTCTAPHAFSEIVECENLAEALVHIDEDTHVFYEIDNVLIEGTTIASQPSFFTELKEELLSQGYTPDQIANKLYPIWVKVHQIAEVVPCNEFVSLFIDQLNHKKIPAIALTCRGPRLAYKTLDQLHSHDLYFEHNYQCARNHVFEDNLSMYFEGMLFVHPVCNKSQRLIEFLNFMNLQPKKIVFIDHELIHLVDLGQALEQMGIKFTGVYLKSNTRELSDWDIQIGKLQLEYLESILPNNYAQHIADLKGDA